ncbi:chromosome segregation protein SMC [Candidatus Magnetoovum chiemensis]|nr:chromosome segregation protein SMC [Candidatus Magnetoovum chiemensis]
MKLTAQHIEKEIEDNRQKISKLKETLAYNKSRLNSLEEITRGDSPHDELLSKFNVLASVSEELEVEEKYELAVESALSDKIRGLIFENTEDLINALTFFKQKTNQRGAFICPDLINHNDDTSAFKYEDVLVRDIIKSKNGHSKVLNAILKDYVIVNNIDRAIEIKTANRQTEENGSHHIVTLDGDIIEPSGMVITGKSDNILKNLREIRSLKKVITNSETEIKDMEILLAKKKQEKENIKKEIETVNAYIIETEKQISISNMDLKKFIEEKNRLTKKSQYIDIELQQNEKELHNLNNTAQEKDVYLKEIQKNRSDLTAYIEDIRNSLTDKKAALETNRSMLMEKKMSSTKLKEQLNRAKSDTISFGSKIEKLETKLSDIKKEIETLTIKKETINKTINETKISLKSSYETLEKEQEIKQSEKAIIDKVSQTLQEIDAVSEKQHSEANSLITKKTHLEVKLAEDKLKMENIKNIVNDSCAQKIEDISLEPLEANEEERIDILKSKIKEIGSVNMESIKDYEEAKQRYEFLQTQHSDLIKSIEELEEAIRKINATTKRKLTEAYNILNEKFQEMFKYFFNGGKAELVLTDSEDILEAGIDIIIQPPGKKLQSINLLSGGEKTLSVLSLIFAGLRIKSTPLCILDEADAALDEANTRKYSEVLKTLSKDTQLIVITHNRTTIQAADYIYGVTNEEQGVSKVISMKLTEV